MDLYAYTQIQELEDIAKSNDISVPRLRGYRLMADEKRLSEDEIDEQIKEHEFSTYQHAVISVPAFDPNSHCICISRETDLLEKKYLIKKRIIESDEECTWSYNKIVGFRWDRIHGKKRKNLKFMLKRGRKAVRKQLETFNRYAGRDDVLYIHARIGGDNWSYYGGGEIEKKPWFIEKVDDYFDSTYCDIYARIKVKEC